MTLSIGVRCPSPKSPSRAFGIVLAADTRYSYLDGTQYDQGEKVFSLGRYSGCAAAASNGNHVFRAVAALRRVFSPAMPATGEETRGAVLKVLGEVDADLAKRGEEPGYHLIIGSYAQDGAAVIVCVGDASQVDGQELYLEWGVSIGLREYSSAFDRALRAGVAKTLATGNELNTAGDQALAVALALHECVKADLHPGIGGGVQIALITPERGYQRLEVSLWNRATDVIEVLTPPLSRGPTSPTPGRHVPIDLIRLVHEVQRDEESPAGAE